MSNLEALLKAYVELSILWSKTHTSETHSRFWASCSFLERQITQELKHLRDELKHQRGYHE